MDRREFVTLATMAVTASPFVNGQANNSRIVVTDFGADPKGVKDSTAAIATAVQQVHAKGAHVLVFPKGTYRVGSAADAAVNLENLTGIEVDGGGSTIVMGSDATCLNFLNCHDLHLHDLSIDYDPLPFVQGNIVSTNPASFVIDLDPGYAFLPNTPIYAYGIYDRSLRLRTKDPIPEWYEDVRGIQKISDSRYRIQVPNGHSFSQGRVALLRHAGRHHAVMMRNVNRAAIERTNIYASYLFAFNIAQSKDITLDQVFVTIPETGNRLMSTNRDGLHITQTTGELNVHGCQFFAMGDDSINIYTPIVFSHVRADGRFAVTTDAGNEMSPSSMAKTGELVEILDPDDLHVVSSDVPSEELEKRVRELSHGRAASFVTVNPNMTPVTHITDSHFLGARGRGIVGHNHLTVRNCTFRNTTGPAILLAPMIKKEGPLTRDVVIDLNHFSGCDYSSHDSEGTITADVGHDSSTRPKVINGYAGGDLKITNNVFNDCYTAAVSCRALNLVTISGNEIGRTWIGNPGRPSRPAIIAEHLAHSNITDNTSTTSNSITVVNCVETTVSGNRGLNVIP